MPLSELQVRVATIVLAVPAAAGFALAGGAALIFYGITDRATQDIDCFGPTPDAVDRLHPAAVAALEAAGLRTETQQQGPGFARLRVTSGRDETLLDLGFDPAQRPALPTPLGAVRALDDLAGDKLLALFSRAEPRDFLDVAGLLHRYHRTELETFAAAKDLGFNRSVLADAFGVLPTIRRDRFDVDDATYAGLLETFRTWHADLDANRREGAP